MQEARFIQSNAKLLTVPLVPEVRLYLAEESMPIWQKTEEELGRMNVPPPYWAFAWAGGQALARHLLDKPALVAGHTVLDLGAGSGLTSIAAMKAGATCWPPTSTATPWWRLRSILRQMAFVSRQRTPTCSRSTRKACVLVGDMFYERALAERALAFVEAARANGAEVLVGDPRRSYFPTERFIQVAEYSVPVTRDLEDMEIKHTAVWQLA